MSLEAIVINCREPAVLAPFNGDLIGLPAGPDDEAAIAAGTLGSDESVLLEPGMLCVYGRRPSANCSPRPSGYTSMCAWTFPVTWEG